MSFTRRFHRHPLCPKCRYDVAATVDKGGSICPECGYEFEWYELKPQVLPGDWTFARGLRKAFLFLTVKAVICIIVAGPLLLFPVHWMLRRIEGAAPLLDFLLVIATLIIIVGGGWVVGCALTRRITDHAGFRSPALAWTCGAFAWAVILISTSIGHHYGRISAPEFFQIASAAGVAATIAVVSVFLMRE